MESESTDVWDYFDKCGTDEIGERRATCRVCSNVYNYNATIHNLKIHLQRKHSVVIGKIAPGRTKTSAKERPKRNTEIWGYFSPVEGKERFASCHICDKVLSYQTTTNNLKTHLRKQHPLAYSALEQATENNQPTEVEYVEEYLESDNDDEVSTEDVKQTDIWGYFESDTATTAICCVCCASVPSKKGELRRHLVAEHPKLVGEILTQDEDNNDDVYSEVIYVEENPMTKEQKVKVKKIDFDSYKRAKKRRVSQEKPKKSIDEEEVESFGSYITCLMKQLPRDVCTNVQRDIINLIMNAKTRSQNKIDVQQNLIKEIMKDIQCDKNSSFESSEQEEKTAEANDDLLEDKDDAQKSDDNDSHDDN
ncbi:uncharacterized protein LOC135085981 [Ostrinia nubilalis]|uniref:uncharacterized protein LOC135085981 n=1 Tax=Ostrinia nubilalis TaxID=29057 RepID=UPI0030824436